MPRLATPIATPAGGLLDASVAFLAAQRERENRSRAIKAAFAQPSYGDTSFRGNGVILCTICGEPCAEHRIGPCPKWEGRR